MTTNSREVPEYVTSLLLWEGSLLQTTAKYGPVIPSDIEDSIQKLHRCDDLTGNEKKWLAGLERWLSDTKTRS